jgi:hypothetical protein
MNAQRYKEKLLVSSNTYHKEGEFLLYDVFVPFENKTHKMAFLSPQDKDDFVDHMKDHWHNRNAILYACVTLHKDDVTMDMTEYLKEFVYYVASGKLSWGQVVKYIVGKNKYFTQRDDLEVSVYYEDDESWTFGPDSFETPFFSSKKS